ncbi:hypothetical protein W823_23555 [Williamsia sp. D3]|nr:hypothetical protein W823_23555 [Williamsia sp. D3]
MIRNWINNSNKIAVNIPADALDRGCHYRETAFEGAN